MLSVVEYKGIGHMIAVTCRQKKKKRRGCFGKKVNKRIETRAFSGSGTRSNSERVYNYVKPPHPLVVWNGLRIGFCIPPPSIGAPACTGQSDDSSTPTPRPTTREPTCHFNDAKPCKTWRHHCATKPKHH